MAQAAAIERFEGSLNHALKHVRLILDTERAPQLASQVHHQYQDKYVLAECMTNAALASQVNCLASLGLHAEHFERMAAWAGQGQAVSLCFQLRTVCTHDRVETREVEDPQKLVVESKVGAAVAAVFTSKVVTTVEEHFWKVEGRYELSAVRGVGAEGGDRISILERTSHGEMTTSAEVPPHVGCHARQEVNVTWLLKQLEAPACSPRFRIDRKHAKCHTPRRNADVDAAEGHFAGLCAWTSKVRESLSTLFGLQPDTALQQQADQVVAQCSAAVLVPVLPLLQEGAPGETAEPAAPCGFGAERADGPAGATEPPAPPGVLARLAARGAWAGSRALGVPDANHLLAEELRSLSEQCAAAAQAPALPAGSAPGGAEQAALAVTLAHCGHVCQRWAGVVGYIEQLLRQQLVAAIGKEVAAADVAQYMLFHGRRIFRAPFAPSPFCVAVRRSERHDPEGTLSLEEAPPGVGPCGLFGVAGAPAPIATLAVRSAPEAVPSMRFALGASTFVTFRGDRCLHAWLSHRFSGLDGAAGKLSLVARARQFSSMLVLVGRIVSATQFEPTCAAIVQNKDELRMPLDLATIPTAKEFKDAIDSLSPEQQAFAKAFRAMQLESTLFGILVIHIKPQLEAVLNLPPDALTKEIKLTQDLMQMFVKYQIPSDLLSYSAGDQQSSAGGTGNGDGVELVGEASASERLVEVKAHVQAMKDLIEESKKEELLQATGEARYAAPLKAPFQADLLCMGGAGAAAAPPALGGIGLAMSRGLPGAAGGGSLFGQNTGGGMFGQQSSGGGAFGQNKGGLFGAPAPSPPAMEVGCLFGAPAAPEGGGLFGARAAPPAAPPQAAAAPVRAASPQAANLASAPWAAAAAPQQPAGSQAFEQAPFAPQQAVDRVQRSAEHGELAAAHVEDYTRVPREIDARFERMDKGGTCRPTIITPADSWSKRAQKALLAKPSETTLGAPEQKQEKDAAFDLLDALTKSGALPVEHASLHVVVAATHCFDQTVLETVVQENTNPIEHVERSTLIMASAVHQLPVSDLIQESQQERIRGASPALFLDDAAPAANANGAGAVN